VPLICSPNLTSPYIYTTSIAKILSNCQERLFFLGSLDICISHFTECGNIAAKKHMLSNKMWHVTVLHFFSSNTLFIMHLVFSLQLSEIVFFLLLEGLYNLLEISQAPYWANTHALDFLPTTKRFYHCAIVILAYEVVTVPAKRLS